MSNDAAGFASATDRSVAPPNGAFDAGLRPDPFPDRAASLLPGLLAATRTGLAPAGDAELLLDNDLHIDLQLSAHPREGTIQRDRPRLPQGPRALGPRGALGGAAGLARNEGLRRVHLRRIRDTDLFEDRCQLLAERVARVLGLPDVDDAESARAFAGCVGKKAPDRPVRH